MARVLVIDDEVDEREAVQQMLESAGHEVILAAGGKEGLAKYRLKPVDLILLDLFMPEQDGFETMLVLRREFPDVRIIAMSGNIVADAMLSVARRLGSVAVLEKPFTQEQLLMTVEKIV
jgi:CheY-like chemotaxis protein